MTFDTANGAQKTLHELIPPLSHTTTGPFTPAPLLLQKHAGISVASASPANVKQPSWLHGWCFSRFPNGDPVIVKQLWCSYFLLNCCWWHPCPLYTWSCCLITSKWHQNVPALYEFKQLLHAYAQHVLHAMFCTVTTLYSKNTKKTMQMYFVTCESPAFKMTGMQLAAQWLQWMTSTLSSLCGWIIIKEICAKVELILIKNNLYT